MLPQGMSLGSSSIALSGASPVPAAATDLRFGRLAGGDGRLPTTADRDRPVLETVFRRALMETGRGIGTSPDSWRAAATAAMLAPVFVMLLRRVTRLVPLRALPMIECELLREWVCRPRARPPGTGLDEMEGRWLNGREVCCVS